MDRLRVHVITEEDPFYIPVFFREFFRLLPANAIVLTGIDITPPLNQRRSMALARRLLRFYGLRDFLRLCFRYAWAKGKNAVLPLGRWDGTVSRLAAARGVPCGPVSDVNNPEYVRRIQALQPDVLLSVAASQIFKPALLAVPRIVSLNIHTGKLPQYRGMLPVFWQLHDGCSEIGLTVHTMTEKIDLGEVVLERSVRTDSSWSLDAAIREMKKHGARAVLDALELARSGRIVGTPMNRGEAGYRSFPVAADARQFRRRGLRLL